jgi:hypothetical protein
MNEHTVDRGGEVSPVRIEMKQFGKTLATRPLGAEVRTELEKFVAKNKEELILFDLHGVLVFSHSFGDELFGVMAKRTEAGRYGKGRRIAFVGANEFAAETLDSVFRIRRTRAPVVRDKGEWTLVGAIEPQAHRVLDTLRKLGKAETGEIARRLRASLPAVNNWLHELIEAGVVERERSGEGSGRPFVYRIRQPVPSRG